jgi:hypothetical protein
LEKELKEEGADNRRKVDTGVFQGRELFGGDLDVLIVRLHFLGDISHEAVNNIVTRGTVLAEAELGHQLHEESVASLPVFLVIANGTSVNHKMILCTTGELSYNLLNDVHIIWLPIWGKFLVAVRAFSSIQSSPFIEALVAEDVLAWQHDWILDG